MPPIWPAPMCQFSFLQILLQPPGSSWEWPGVTTGSYHRFLREERAEQLISMTRLDFGSFYGGTMSSAHMGAGA